MEEKQKIKRESGFKLEKEKKGKSSKKREQKKEKKDLE